MIFKLLRERGVLVLAIGLYRVVKGSFIRASNLRLKSNMYLYYCVIKGY